MWPTGFPETSVWNYPSRLRNIPEERRSQIAPYVIHKREISQSADFLEIFCDVWNYTEQGSRKLKNMEI